MSKLIGFLTTRRGKQEHKMIERTSSEAVHASLQRRSSVEPNVSLFATVTEDGSVSVRIEIDGHQVMNSRHELRNGRLELV